MQRKCIVFKAQIVCYCSKNVNFPDKNVLCGLLHMIFKIFKTLPSRIGDRNQLVCYNGTPSCYMEVPPEANDEHYANDKKTP